MESLEEIKGRIQAAVPGAGIEIIPNPGPANQPSLLLDHAHASRSHVSCAMIRPCASITAPTLPASIGSIDGEEKDEGEKLVEGEEKEVEETEEEFFPGYLEAVYHLYSMAHKHGPVVVRLRTNDRAEGARFPHSLRSGAARNFRNARSTICTASTSTAIPICAAS